MKKDTVIRVNDDKKTNNEGAASTPPSRLQAGFEIAADMNENLIFAPQIYWLVGFAGIQCLWTIIAMAIGGFMWPGIFFFLFTPPLIAMIFLPDYLNIKWHIFGQALAWLIGSMLLIAMFSVTQGNYKEAYARYDAASSGPKKDYWYATEISPRFWFMVYAWVSQVFIWPCILILIRMTWHAWKNEEGGSAASDS